MAQIWYCPRHFLDKVLLFFDVYVLDVLYPHIMFLTNVNLAL